MRKRFLAVLFCMLTMEGSALAQGPATGFPPYGSFEDGRFDAVNRQNLNVNFAIPIVSVPGRGLNLQHFLAYNSLVWTRAGNTWTPVVDEDGNPTWGWLRTDPIGKTYHSESGQWCNPDDVTYDYAVYMSGYRYVDPSGTVHTFGSVMFYDWATACDFPTEPRTGYADDGSGFFLDATDPYNPVVVNPSGVTVIGPQWNGLSFDHHGKMTDTNGNYITAASVVGSVTTWKDSLGRNALKIDKKSSKIYYDYQDKDGNYQRITLNLQTFNIKTKFDCAGVNEFTGSASLPISVVLPNGQSYQFTYETNLTYPTYKTGRLERVALPTGGYYEYTYPTTGNKGINCSNATGTNLTRKISAGESTPPQWTFVRTQVGSDWKTTVTPPVLPYDTVANVSTHTFNSSGQAITERHYQGEETGPNLRRTIATTWAGNGTPSSTLVTLDDGQQAKTETTLDSYGNLILINEFAFGPGAPGSPVRTTQITYETGAPYAARNILNRVKQVIVREGDITGPVKSRKNMTYDGTVAFSGATCITGAPQHNDTNYGCSFLTRGNPISVTTYTDAATPGGAITKNIEYDSLGNARKADVNCCQQKEWIYTATTAYAYPETTKHGPTGNQLITHAAFNFYTGLVTSVTDENDQTTSFTYDLQNKRLTKITRPNNAEITYTYEDATRNVTEDSPVDGSSKIRRKYHFDLLGRQFRTDVSKTDNTDCSSNVVAYDPIGHLYRRYNPIVCGSSLTKGVETRVDVLGRPLATHLVNASDGGIVAGHSSAYAYSGSSVTFTDQAVKQRKWETDALGRQIRISEPDVTSGDVLTVATTYQYNVLNMLTLVTQGDQTRTYTYDDVGRIVNVATPESKHQGTQYSYSYQYNAFDLVTQRTDARGVVTTYGYDARNLLQTVSYNVGTTGVPATDTTTYEYGTGATPYDKGRLKKVTNGSGANEIREEFSYDQLGRLTQAQKLIGGVTYTINYGYNDAGQVKTITYPSGRVVTRTYDIIGRRTAISSGATQYINNFTYDAASQLVTSYKYGNDAVTAAVGYSVDTLQLTSLSYTKINDPGPFFSLNYWYKQDATSCPTGTMGNNGQIQCISDNVDAGRTVRYTYDALHRLKTSVTTGSAQYPQWGLEWIYDRYGNRDEQRQTYGSPPTHDPAIDPETNRISGYCYDENGNLRAESAFPCPAPMYAYDAENRMVTYLSGGGSGAYTYNGANLRVKRVATTNSTTTTVYVFSGTKVIAEYENGAAVASPTREYVYSGADLVATHEGGALKYHYRDHQSVRVTSDINGATRSEQGHYPYGEKWYPSGTQDPATKYQLTSYEREAESGNDYAVFREYTVRNGRFLSPDPIAGSVGNPQSLNRYSYTNNDPINLIDPLGLSEWCFGYHVWYITIDSESGDIESVRYGGFISLYCWDDGGGGEGGEGGGGGGGAEGRPQGQGQQGIPANAIPYVDLKVLQDCLDKLFGVKLTQFSGSRRGEHGSFAGYGPDGISNGGNDADIYIINDVTRYSSEQHPNASGFTNYPGVVPGDTESPYRNFTLNDIRDNFEILKTQVHELGNSLGMITGAANNRDDQVQYPGGAFDSDWGAKLERCVGQGHGFRYRTPN